MSREATTELARRVREDADFSSRLDAAIAGKEGEAARDALLGFAKAEGFDLDAAEASALLGLDGELSETDLAGIAGGMPIWRL